MALSKAVTAEVMKEYQRSNNDTGSSEVQIALLTHRISALTEHLKQFKKDNHSRRGLLNLVSQRRRLLDYFKRTNRLGYEELIKRLGIRR